MILRELGRSAWHIRPLTSSLKQRIKLPQDTTMRCARCGEQTRAQQD